MDKRWETAIERLKKRQKDMEHYAAIIEKAHIIDVSCDADFQREFNYFYRVRRDEAWRKSFYTLFEACKKREALSFSYILRELHRLTGRVEASFSSKLLATLNVQMPIWDSIVLAKLGIKPRTYRNHEKRLEETAACYEQIVYWYRGFLQSKGAGAVLDAFDCVFPMCADFSDVKKIDFLIWGSGDINLFESKEVEPGGCLEVSGIITEKEWGKSLT